MGVEIGFYHCTRQPADRVAVRLVAKAHAAGQRVVIVADPARLEALDGALWTDDPASFLPHARAGALDDAEQPILLSPDARPANGAGLLMLIEAPLPDAPERFERIVLLFDEGSPAQAQARQDWRAARKIHDGCLSYWQQTPDGAWERKDIGA